MVRMTVVPAKRIVLAWLCWSVCADPHARPIARLLTARSAGGTLGVRVTIQLNGEPFETSGPLSVSRLLAALAVDPRRVAVEHNRLVVKKAAYDSTVVAAGDEVEVVNFVGGG